MRKPEDVARIEREAAAVTLLRDQLATLDATEPELLEISIESETNFRELVTELLDREAEAVAFIAAIKARKGELSERQDRYEARKEAIRGLLAFALEASGLPKQETAVGTVSLLRVAPKAIVTDESEIPTRFWKTSDPTLDKAALNEALKARAKAEQAVAEIADPEERAVALAKLAVEHPIIPGASLSNGGAAVTIRRS